MCNGIAHSGNGIVQYIANPTEGLTQKSARLLTAAMSPRPIKISLNISPDGSGADVLKSVAASSKDAGFASPHGSPVLYSNSDLYPGSRFHAYLLLTSPTAIPKSVVLRAQLHSGKSFSLDIPVAERVTNEGSNHLIHPLVAQKLIQDLNLSDPAARALAMTLAKTYNILSEATSFISVDESALKTKKRWPPSHRPGRGGRSCVKSRLFTDYTPSFQLSTIARDRTPSLQLSAIARHQSFNGSFHSSVLPLCPLEKNSSVLPASVMKIEDDELRAQISASLFVIRFLKTEMKDEQEAWKMMYEKDVAFLKGIPLVSSAELDEFLQMFA